MSSFERKTRRNILRKELGSNNISEEYHKRYGHYPQKSKSDLKVIERLKKRLRKLSWLKSRAKRKKVNNEDIY